MTLPITLYLYRAHCLCLVHPFRLHQPLRDCGTGSATQNSPYKDRVANTRTQSLLDHSRTSKEVCKIHPLISTFTSNIVRECRNERKKKWRSGEWRDSKQKLLFLGYRFRRNSLKWACCMTWLNRLTEIAETMCSLSPIIRSGWV